MSSILTHDAAHDICLSRELRPSLLSRLWLLIVREIRVRRDLRALSSLDDAALRDIGLARGGLEDAVRHGLPRSGTPLEHRSAQNAEYGSAIAPSPFTEWR